MQPASEDKEFLEADGTTPEDKTVKSPKMVEVVHLLQANLVKTTRLMWCQLFFIGALLILLFIAYSPLIAKLTSGGDTAATSPKFLAKPLPMAETASQSNVPPTQQSVKPSVIPEWQEVQGTLDQLRRAQLAKDINLFLHAYSSTFPNLAEKKASLLKSWQKYNYLVMNFNIENIHKRDDQTIIAEVAWDITLEEVHTKKRVTLMKDYIINFSNVSGKPLIEEVTQEKRGNKGDCL